MAVEMREQEFVPLRDFAAESGLPTRTIRRHIRLLGLALFEDPRDRRGRMLRAEDAAQLQTRRLVRPDAPSRDEPTPSAA